MKSQALLTVWCNISGGAGGEFWHWSLSGVKGLKCAWCSRAVWAPHRWSKVNIQCGCAVIYLHCHIPRRFSGWMWVGHESHYVCLTKEVGMLVSIWSNEQCFTSSWGNSQSLWVCWPMYWVSMGSRTKCHIIRSGSKKYCSSWEIVHLHLERNNW